MWIRERLQRVTLTPRRARSRCLDRRDRGNSDGDFSCRELPDHRQQFGRADQFRSGPRGDAASAVQSPVPTHRSNGWRADRRRRAHIFLWSHPVLFGESAPSARTPSRPDHRIDFGDSSTARGTHPPFDRGSEWQWIDRNPDQYHGPSNASLFTAVSGQLDLLDRQRGHGFARSNGRLWSGHQLERQSGSARRIDSRWVHRSHLWHRHRSAGLSAVHHRSVEHQWVHDLLDRHRGGGAGSL